MDIKEQEIYNDEISLIDLFKVIKKRKNTFYVVFALTVMLAIAFTVTMEPVYKSKAVIRIGSVGSVGSVEPVLELVKRLQEEYRVDDDTEAEILPPYVSTGFNVSEILQINSYILTHSIKHDYAAVFPLSNIFALLVLSGVYLAGQRVNRVFSVFISIAYLVSGLLQNVSGLECSIFL